MKASLSLSLSLSRLLVIAVLMFPFAAGAQQQATGQPGQNISAQFNQLTAGDRERITNLLREFGLLRAEETAQSLIERAQPLTNPSCVALCNIAAALAAQRCGGNPTCLAIVEAARQACVSRC